MIKQAEEQKEGEKKDAGIASIRELLSFATPFDMFLMFIGAIGAIAIGAGQPVIMILFGNLMDAAGGVSGIGPSISNAFNKICIEMCILGVICGVCAIVGESAFKYSGLRQSSEWRKYYLKGILRQDVGWYDTNDPGELSGRIAESTQTLEEGISSKLALGFRYGGQAVFGLAISLWHAWDVSLVVLGASPLVVFGTWFLTKATTEAAGNAADAYAKAGGISSETITSLRTVLSLGAESKQAEKYQSNLRSAQLAGIRKSYRVGFANGLLFSSGNIMAAIGFIYCGFKMARELDHTTVLVGNVTYNCQSGLFAATKPPGVKDCSFSAGDMIVALFALQMGAQGLGLVEPTISALAAARKAAAQIMQVTARVSKVDPFDESGARLDKVAGRITFEDVFFTYPARREHPVCRGYSLTVEPGQTVALVGASGSGKSTAIQLLERFYDPDQGAVKLDGHDLRSLNVNWLRSQIGLVGQEPVLFGGTIADNIAYGKPGATREEIEEAAKMANAHNFIMEFPKGYETDVGAKGDQLSGGQKQRVAIARALIKSPAILLLDEATSALDTESESIVQAALDRVMKQQKRTTLVIAHRLTTIRDADKICVVQEGKIVEEGTHDELMKLGEDGCYWKLNHKFTREQEMKESVAMSQPAAAILSVSSGSVARGADAMNVSDPNISIVVETTEEHKEPTDQKEKEKEKKKKQAKPPAESGRCRREMGVTSCLVVLVHYWLEVRTQVLVSCL
jgi:ATP-binding cassette subfamily B (MDR/TAP) protein 1